MSPALFVSSARKNTSAAYGKNHGGKEESSRGARDTLVTLFTHHGTLHIQGKKKPRIVTRAVSLKMRVWLAVNTGGFLF
jgi:hypothetical protein